MKNLDISDRKRFNQVRVPNFQTFLIWFVYFVDFAKHLLQAQYFGGSFHLRRKWAKSHLATTGLSQVFKYIPSIYRNTRIVWRCTHRQYICIFLYIMVGGEIYLERAYCYSSILYLRARWHDEASLLCGGVGSQCVLGHETSSCEFSDSHSIREMHRNAFSAHGKLKKL